MDVYQFISAVLRTLAWPVVCLVALILFRDAINRLLGTVVELDVSGVKAKFQGAFNEVKEAAALARLSDPQAASGTTTLDSPDAKEAKKVSSDAPAIGILLAWRVIEDALKASARRLAVDSAALDTAPLSLLDNPSFAAKVDSSTIYVIRGMRSLRDRVAHDPATASKVSAADVRDYLRIAEGVAERLSGVIP